MATTEMQLNKFDQSVVKEALEMIKNTGLNFGVKGKDGNTGRPTDEQCALLGHVAKQYGLSLATDIVWLGKPYVTAPGLQRLAQGRLKSCVETYPTRQEIDDMKYAGAAEDGDAFGKVIVTLTDGTVIEQIGTANAENCAIATPVVWENNQKKKGKTDRRVLWNMACTRAKNRILRTVTGCDLGDAESVVYDYPDAIDVSPTPAAQFVAETPKQRTPKAPKAEPTPEPAKPAEAEVETAKAENRARWAAESETPAAAETVIETTVASKKSAPSPTPSVEAVADALTRLKERRDKPGFPVGAYVAAAFEDAQKFVDTAGAKGDYRAAFLIGRWHKSAEEIDGVWRSEPWQKFVGAAGSDVDALRKACVEFSPVSDDEPTPQDNF